MSDLMLKGVLRMPYHMVMGDAVSAVQFYERAQEALDRMERAEKALNEAATSLETLAALSGRKTYGDPPIDTYMETFLQVRGYAASRAKVAREALAALSAKAPQ